MDIKKLNYIEEIVRLIRETEGAVPLSEVLDNYHDNDIAEALEFLTPEERFRLYDALESEQISDIFSYLEEAAPYFEEMGLEDAVEIIENMDSDDAVDILEGMDEEIGEKLVEMLDEEVSQDIRLIQSYEEDEIGSKMTTNFIAVQKGLTVKAIMKELIAQAEENDNIYTVYVCDEQGCFYGAIDLKDLITARAEDNPEEFISHAYPYVYDHEAVSDCLEKIISYAEDSIPVLDKSNKILGIITSQDIIEAVDEELGEDYAMLAGLSEEEDLEETARESMRKRLPWLIALLGLGMGVSAVVGVFEAVVAEIAVIVCFQSLILGMAGNVGTQSLAVTIRVLMDENMGRNQKLRLVWREMRVGFGNGLLLGVISFLAIGVYVWLAKGYGVSFSFAVSGCVGLSLLIAMLISSCVGTLVPMFFHKVKIDPAVASGPLITTINDLVAVVSYYGLAWILLIQIMKIG